MLVKNKEFLHFFNLKWQPPGLLDFTIKIVSHLGILQLEQCRAALVISDWRPTSPCFISWPFKIPRTHYCIKVGQSNSGCKEIPQSIGFFLFFFQIELLFLSRPGSFLVQVRQNSFLSSSHGGKYQIRNMRHNIPRKRKILKRLKDLHAECFHSKQTKLEKKAIWEMLVLNYS